MFTLNILGYVTKQHNFVKYSTQSLSSVDTVANGTCITNIHKKKSLPNKSDFMKCQKFLLHNFLFDNNNLTQMTNKVT